MNKQKPRFLWEARLLPHREASQHVHELAYFYVPELGRRLLFVVKLGAVILDL